MTDIARFRFVIMIGDLQDAIVIMIARFAGLILRDL